MLTCVGLTQIARCRTSFLATDDTDLHGLSRIFHWIVLHTALGGIIKTYHSVSQSSCYLLLGLRCRFLGWKGGYRTRVVGNMIPMDDYMIPMLNYMSPMVGDTIPMLNYMIPKDDYINSKDDYMNPMVDNTNPKDDYTTPMLNYTTPMLNYTTPMDEHMIPMGDYISRMGGDRSD